MKLWSCQELITTYVWGPIYVCWLKGSERKRWGTNGFKSEGFNCQGPCSGHLGLFSVGPGRLPNDKVECLAKMVEFTVSIYVIYVSFIKSTCALEKKSSNWNLLDTVALILAHTRAIHIHIKYGRCPLVFSTSKYSPLQTIYWFNASANNANCVDITHSNTTLSCKTNCSNNSPELWPVQFHCIAKQLRDIYFSETT